MIGIYCIYIPVYYRIFSFSPGSKIGRYLG